MLGRVNNCRSGTIKRHTDVFYVFEVVIIRPKVWKVLSPFVKSGQRVSMLCDYRKSEKATHSLLMRLRTETSFSTVKSSNVCGVKASFRKILLQIGHGAGPSVNNRSMQDSHLC
jgi:hypothetical protein